MTAILEEILAENPRSRPLAERLAELPPLCHEHSFAYSPRLFGRPSPPACKPGTGTTPVFWQFAAPGATGWACEFNCEHAGISPREHLQADRIPALHLPTIRHCNVPCAAASESETYPRKGRVYLFRMTQPDVWIDATTFQKPLGKIAEGIAQKVKQEALLPEITRLDLHILVRQAMCAYISSTISMPTSDGKRIATGRTSTRLW